MLAKISEDFGERGARLLAPGRDTAVGGGKRREWGRGTVRAEKSEGDCEGRGRTTGYLIEDVAGYRVSLGEGGGVVPLGASREGSGLVHFLLGSQRGDDLIVAVPILMFVELMSRGNTTNSEHGG